MRTLALRNLTIKIAEKTICHDLELTVYPGEIWGILGPNGSGKTTLLHTLAGLLPPFSGEIYLDDKPLQHFSSPELAKIRALLLQSPEHVGTHTVWEYCALSRYPHLGFFPKLTEKDYAIMMSALKKMGLIAHVHKKMTELSGGERRRLGLAALLCQAPTLYLLDEPTNHLDIFYQMKIMKLGKSLVQKGSFAIIMTLHDVNYAQAFCDHLLLLFPDGDAVAGKTDILLTGANLNRLYAHPMHAISYQNSCFWVPEY